MNSQKKVIIIGSGPGGYHAAICLSRFNCNVTLIEREHIGGVCLNVGCIPTKALLDHISLFEHFTEATTKRNMFNLGGGNISINADSLRKYQLDIIKQLGQGLEKLFEKKRIKVIFGSAKLLSKNTILVDRKGEKQEISADEIIIATGSKPRSVPGFIFDKKFIISSDDIWNIPSIPGKLLIVGSGPIGIEFARVFKGLGSDVTVAEIKEIICPVLDLEVSENLVRSLKKRKINVKPNTASKFISLEKDKVKVEFISTIDGKRENAEYDQVLIAVGRSPNTENLGLEEADVATEGLGFIQVSEYLQSTQKNIWAVGDVTNYPQLAHTASFQGRVVASNILGNTVVFDARYIPSCIFGYPEIAFVGETEESLKEKKIQYRTGKYLFLANGKAKASGHTEGLVKVLVDSKSNKLLGAHIMGPEASTLIHELVVAMQNNLTIDNIIRAIHAHPTYSEVVLEALEDSIGEAVHV